ncbi:T9SS type B sorting domain-containing protein [Sabulilitoribacter arenilitoris]|uniref:T9SS type B sorting domain-containing protein n=1 Tax=Wocania arenilitoris TaxID=2044858 RepID=A0AAE3JMD9_9FLAO|nr:T9SS type B sorting domain-containing protein [Wocania arenilitoris]MCF7569227.1 T9SS type B sorting domain-containing protein [Wocania arenilitoris]
MKRIVLIFFIVFSSFKVFSQWVHTGGPYGGYTNELVEAGTFLVLNTGNGGIYRSANNGDTWEWSSYGLPCNYGVTALVENEGILYAAIGVNGIYKSLNNGLSWSPTNIGIEDKTFYSLFVIGDNIYAGNSEGGVYFSPNSGESWLNKSNGISDFRAQTFEVFNSKVYIGGATFSLSPSRVLYETSDGGDTWTNVSVPNIGSNGISSMVVKNNILYVGNDNTVYKSTDLLSWNNTTINSNATIVNMGATATAVYATTSFGRYFYSEDDGVTWNLIQNINDNTFANHLYFSADKIIMSTYRGLYKSTNMGQSWSESNVGIAAQQIESLNYNSNYLFAGTDNQGVYRTADGGVTWSNVSNGLNALNSQTVTDIVVVGEDLYLATGGGVYSSTDDGASWVRKFNPGINKSAQALDYDDGVFVTAVNGNGVYISQDMGSSWVLVNTNGINIDTSYESIIIKGNTIVVSTADSEIFVSEDLGSNWKNVSIPIGFFIASDFEFENNRLYVATTQGLYFSDNLGNNWQRISFPLEIYDLIIDSDKIYVATSSGIYVISENYNTWDSLCDGLGLQFTNQLLIKEDVIYAGTYNSGVWKRFKVEGDLPVEEDDLTIGNNIINLCPNNSPVNLFTEIGLSEDIEGLWTPELSSGTGIFNPSSDLAGIYKFTYLNDICGCEAYSKVQISFNGLGAGTSKDLAICKSSESIDLIEKLGENVDPNGIWYPSLISQSNIFDPLQDSEGSYTYTVQNNCGISTAVLNISLFDSVETPDYKINISEFSNSNSLSIDVNSGSQYEYSLDGINFQISNTFSNLPGGNYTVYGKEINGCGEFQEEVYILSYPRYFTPNGDGVNDVWNIKGISDNNYDLLIFDRFGKLLKTIYGVNNYGWDGVFKGNPLPATDYWFKVLFYDGKQKLGHFALKR